MHCLEGAPIQITKTVSAEHYGMKIAKKNRYVARSISNGKLWAEDD